MKKLFILTIKLSFLLYLCDLFVFSKINSYLRVQDIATLFALPIVFILKKEDGLRKNTTFLICSYVGFSLVTSSLGYFSNTVDSRFLLYILKEAEYFISFYVFMYMSSKHKIFSKNCMLVLMFSGIGYGLWLILSGQINHYGIGSLVSPAPSVSGNYYFSIFILSIYFMKEKKSKVIAALALVSAVLTVFTISRTYILGLLLFVTAIGILSIEIRFFKIKINIKTIASALLITNVLVISLYGIGLSNTSSGMDSITEYKYISSTVERMSKLTSAVETRKGRSRFYMDELIIPNPHSLIIGLGKGSPEYSLGTTTLAVDNQYLRFIIEMGFVGTFIWLWIVFYATKLPKGSRQSFEARMLYSVIIVYFIMGLGTEVFQTTRPALFLWSFIGMMKGQRNSISNRSV